MQEVHQFLKILSDNGCAKPLVTLEKVHECVRARVGPELETLLGDLGGRVEGSFGESKSVGRRVDIIRNEVREFG